MTGDDGQSMLDSEAQPHTLAAYQRKAMIMTVVLIGLGAAVGANARFFMSEWALARWGSGFPYGTMLINVLGSLLIGVVLALAQVSPLITQPVRLLLVTGLLGGFTTFSTFSFEAYTLLSKGRVLAALGYAGSSVVLGLLGVALGVALVALRR